MTEDARTFEELKAEQDALWVEINSKPAPPGYDEYVSALVQEGIDYCNRPDAVFYTQEEVEQMMAERRAKWLARSTDTHNLSVFFCQETFLWSKTHAASKRSRQSRTPSWRR